jgi:hypothetical protein
MRCAAPTELLKHLQSFPKSERDEHIKGVRKLLNSLTEVLDTAQTGESSAQPRPTSKSPCHSQVTAICRRCVMGRN